MFGKWLLPIIFFLAVLLVPISKVDAHRSGCHAWHSCQSDTGSYVCGDTGHYNYCGYGPGPIGPTLTYKTTSEDIVIPFQTNYTSNPSFQQGTTRISVAGVNGAQRKYYQETYSDGVYQSKAWLRDETLSEPVNEVIERGTASPTQVLASSTDSPKKNYAGWWITGGIIAAGCGIGALYSRNKGS